MASAYPGALDTLSTAKADGTATATDHPAHHNDLADAVNKIEAELGTAPSGVAATVKAKLDGLWINAVAEYGAVANSSTNNDTAINNAITAANAAGGGIVYLPAATGTYRISEIVMKSEVWLMGGGIGTELRSIASNTNDGLITQSATSDVDFWISDLALHGLHTSQSVAVDGIHLDGTGETGDTRWRIWNMRIIQCKGDGVHIVDRSGTGYMDNVYITSCQAHGVNLEGNASDNHFRGVQCGLSGLNGWEIGSGTNKFVQCEGFHSGQVDSSTNGDGFHVTTPFNNTFVACKAQDNLRHAFHFEDATDTTMTGCRAWRNDGNALRLDTVTDSRFELDVGYSASGSVGTHSRILELVGTNARNKVEVSYTIDSLDGATAPVNGTATDNEIRVFQGGANVASPTFAASFTPDPYLYETAAITLTANITINAPTYQHRGQRLRFILIENGTGGWTIGFNAVFKTPEWLPSTAANAVNVIEFQCDGTNWNQTFATTPPTATYTTSNVTTDRTFNANAYTMDELADVLGTLIADLQARDVIA